MTLATVYSRAQFGINAPLVTIEADLSNGLPGLSIVGLPDTEVKESKDRVRAALINSRFEYPARRITVNLAPADLPKGGSRFDLAIALGILLASGQLPVKDLENFEFLGELALGGALRPVQGSLPAAICTRDACRTLVVPRQCASEAALVSGLTILPCDHLLELIAHLCGQARIDAQLPGKLPDLATHDAQADLADVIGQQHARRALEIAAAGQHNLLFIGPPGTGKTMLASRLPGILPPMTEKEALETAAIQSISHHGFNINNWAIRPFRSPHHTASGVALVGGGSHPRPGEISLAHNGVLFLDELPEFDRRVLEVLREPLESGHIIISRAARQSDFPASFQLIAAMNPCPCGYLGHPSGRCHCSAEQIQRYRQRISGPLLDRIDMIIEVPNLPASTFSARPEAAESSQPVRQRVVDSRKRQLARQQCSNARLRDQDFEKHINITGEARAFLHQAVEKLDLSTRAHHRLMRVARTIADMAEHDRVELNHISEAIAYRRLSNNA